MARYFGNSQVYVSMFVAVMAMGTLLQVDVVESQDNTIAPLPALDSGDALALPVFGELICISLVISFIGVLFM